MKKIWTLLSRNSPTIVEVDISTVIIMVSDKGAYQKAFEGTKSIHQTVHQMECPIMRAGG